MPDPSSRPRRPPAAPPFDPAAQPWRPANLDLAAVPAEQLGPDLLRGVLSSPGDWPLDPLGTTEYRHPGREGAPVLAAVLIPLVARPDGVRVMLTQRTAHLHDHAGQISFPGGRLETSDASAVAAALRETHEETGLTGNYVDVLGSMPAYVTSTGFSITPVLSLVRPGFTLAPDSFEVAEVFEVPLAFLMDPANHRLYRAPLPDGREREYYAMPWHRYFIWGATAGILRNLYHMVRHGVAASAGPA
ncbi:CoA pyrophosphatase [Bordetella petrii]|uniref:CoA pyrophosphatase n=1 Tax=Bordetella petrii TaxID=94624 RepID=UPI001E512718|nr:CoA pyrophosphatase [Bordetella petrii]MCD0505478.1 CoA pyrophosphatase [Bordetella petrii]